MTNSYQITEKQYNYLLPVFGNMGSKKLLTRVVGGIGKHYFIGTFEEYKDMLNRCKYLND